MTTRIVICGGPLTGKSTLARSLRARGLPTFCGDPRSKARDPEPDVEYLPEDLPFAGDAGAAQWIATRCLGQPGHWVLEGVVAPRALRRWLLEHEDDNEKPCDRVIWLSTPHVPLSAGQAAMAKGCEKVWREVLPLLRGRGVEVVESGDEAEDETHWAFAPSRTLTRTIRAAAVPTADDGARMAVEILMGPPVRKLTAVAEPGAFEHDSTVPMPRLTREALDGAWAKLSAADRAWIDAMVEDLIARRSAKTSA